MQISTGKVCVCSRLGIQSQPPGPGSKLGIALSSLGQIPVHGMRNEETSTTNGWYIWCGDYSDDYDFFAPLCVEHITDRLPLVEPYLSLPPGYRFLIDSEGYEDIWHDPSLLEA